MLIAPAFPSFAAGFWNVRELALSRDGVELEACYYRNGALDIHGYRAVCTFMRDTRTDVIGRIDPRLLDLLYAAQGWTRYEGGVVVPMHIHSGYRTEKTNGTIRGARRSMHLRGRAADVSIPSVATSDLAESIRKFRAGGVGSYRTYLHVDTGPVRYWTGRGA